MTGIEYRETAAGTEALVDGDSIGTFETRAAAQRAVHFQLTGAVEIHRGLVAAGLIREH